jgi:hypothetical protein
MRTSSWIAAGLVVLGCAHTKPTDVTEVTSVELARPTPTELRRHAAEIQAAQTRQDVAAREDEERQARQEAASRIHQERARVELDLRARINALEEQIDALEEQDGAAGGTGGGTGNGTEAAALLQRRDDLLPLLDRVKSAPDDTWPLVRSEAEAALGADVASVVADAGARGD